MSAEGNKPFPITRKPECNNCAFVDSCENFLQEVADEPGVDANKMPREVAEQLITRRVATRNYQIRVVVEQALAAMRACPEGVRPVTDEKGAPVRPKLPKLALDAGQGFSATVVQCGSSEVNGEDFTKTVLGIAKN